MALRRACVEGSVNQPHIQGLAAIGDGAGGFVIDTIAVRAPGPGEIRVRLQAAGICHTDHASLNWPGPLVLGHEGAGVVGSTRWYAPKLLLHCRANCPCAAPASWAAA